VLGGLQGLSIKKTIHRTSSESFYSLGKVKALTKKYRYNK
jgi:hypothetical protein